MGLVSKLFAKPNADANTNGGEVPTQTIEPKDHQTTERPAAHRPASDTQAPPALSFFFVSGHPRSGTNWISNILNLHPRALCKGEFHFHELAGAFDAFVRQPWYVAHHEPMRSIAQRSFESLVRECLAATRAERPNATTVGDHTPRVLRPIIPGAKYISAVRDGRDVLVSWTFHLLRTAKPEVVPHRVKALLRRELDALPDPTADDYAHRLDRSTRALLDEQPWVAQYAGEWARHVREELRALETARQQGWIDDTLVVRYEQLHADTHAGAQALYRFLALDPEHAEPLSRKTKTLPGFGRDDPRAFYRKGEVGDWRNYFTPKTVTFFKDAAQQELADLGYETHDRWEAQGGAA